MMAGSNEVNLNESKVSSLFKFELLDSFICLLLFLDSLIFVPIIASLIFVAAFGFWAVFIFGYMELVLCYFSVFFFFFGFNLGYGFYD